MDIEKKLADYEIFLSQSIEFLHRVPVTLPDYFKKKLMDNFRQALEGLNEDWEKRIRDIFAETVYELTKGKSDIAFDFDELWEEIIKRLNP